MNPEERAWEIVRRAFEERVPAPRRTLASNRLLLALVPALAGIVLIAAVLTPPGHAVFERVRQAVGVETASRALGALPTPGKLLVQSAESGGTWVVDADGAKRRIGAWDYAQWSPHGLYIVAANFDGLVALDPKGNVRWTLPRPSVAWPAWEGTRTDTRIAYMSAGRLRVVGGDGLGDHLLDAHPYDEPPAWDPGRLHTLAYLSGRAVVLRDADSGRVIWRRPVRTPGRPVWSTDGTRVAIVGTHRVTILTGGGRVVRSIDSLAEVIDAAFRPGSRELAISFRHQNANAASDATDSHSEVKLVDADHPGRARLLFAGPGIFGDVAWSPNGKWLLVDWPTANQWVFLHGSRVHAVANVEQQFPRADKAGPIFQLDGRWCCPP